MPHTPEQFLPLLARHFSHTFTPLQAEAAARLARFAFSPAERPAFILRGYAGTGKTTLVGAFVRALREAERNVVLLAPTGRAAKVLADHAGGEAYTIHRAIYRQRTFNGDDTRFDLDFNKHRGTVFVVDEASMLSRDKSYDGAFGTGCLLEDLIAFVYAAPRCRLLVVGDTAQLPPVGESGSPALQAEVMARYSLDVMQADLTEVVRQEAASSVLAVATALRNRLEAALPGKPSVSVSRHGEVRHLPGDELIEQLVTDYSDYGTEDVIIVTRTNKRANLYNEGIRRRIFDREELPVRGDLVMVVKNNYFWPAQAAKSLSPGERMPLGFVANGDAAEVVRIANVHEQHGFLFADTTLRFPDYAGFELDCRVLLSTLTSESPSLTRDESTQLYERVLADYADIPSKADRMKHVREDPYYNALQLKYAYAVTCHKAQGGQWQRVYIDQGYVPAETPAAEYIRWLYTAVTRTTDRVFLVNWPQSELTWEAEEPNP